MLSAGRAVPQLLFGTSREDPTAPEMLGPHEVPQPTGSYQDGALGCQPSNLQPQTSAMISLHTQLNYSPTAQNTLIHRHAQNSPSTCASRSLGFPLRHSNLGAVRHALRLVWSRLLQALHFTLMLSASKSHTLQAEEFFICFPCKSSSELSVLCTLIVFCQSSFQLRSAPSFLPNFSSMLHKI